MSVVTGTAANFEALFNQVISSAATLGWAASGSGVTRTLTKGLRQIELTYSDSGTYQYLSADASYDSLDLSKTAKIFNPAQVAQPQMVFPINFECYSFSNPDELILVVKYATDHYQQLSFGDSPEPGITSCLWLTGSSEVNPNADASGTVMTMNSTQNAFSNSGGYQGGLFCHSGYFYNEFDAKWHTAIFQNFKSTAAHLGSLDKSNLLYSLPSEFSSSLVLLPIQMVGFRTADVNTQNTFGSVENIKLCRIDHVEPEDIVAYGGDNWKVYPFLQKDAAERNFSSKTHSGTLGYAVRQ